MIRGALATGGTGGVGCAVEEYAGAAPRPEEMIIRYGPPKRLKYLMLGRESRRNEGRTRWREGFGPAGVFYGPPVASSARELFMLGGSWGYGPAVIFYGPSRLPA